MASTFCISVAVWGDHTVEAYSNCSLTSVLYAADFRSLLWTRMFLFRKPWVWFALLVILSIWVLHDRSSEMMTLGSLQMKHYPAWYHVVMRLLMLHSTPLHYHHEIAFPKKDMKYSLMGNTAVLQSYLKHKILMLLKRYIRMSTKFCLVICFNF